jgi:excisionase family DNA binding protein
MQVNIEGLDFEVERLVNRALDKRTTEWFNTKGASEYTGLAPGTLRNLASKGRLPRYGQPGTRLRFKRSDLDAYLEGRRRS